MTMIVRRLDELGRVVLPIELRRVLNWYEKTRLIITAQEDESVVIRRYEPACRLCGSGDGELIVVENGSICKSCLQIALKNSVSGELANGAGEGGE